MKNVEKHIKKIITFDKLMVNNILTESKKNLCSYLDIEHNQFNGILKNFTVKSELSGHNNQICLIDCYNDQKKLLNTLCLKYSFDKKRESELALESSILKILHGNKILVPRVLDSNSSQESHFAYIIMEMIKGKTANSFNLNIDDINKIFDDIQQHEIILNNNLEKLKDQSIVMNLHKEINFKKKLLTFLHDYIPDFTILGSLNFLNQYLNDQSVIDKRTIITDRSVENIFKKENGEIVLIDFSTVRIGTQFDNWIQFIDDPQAHFFCSKEELIQLFFKRNGLQDKDLKKFYVASIYTNLLQGIFTYKKNPRLGVSYFENANNSFMKLKNKKSVLIDINHQHAQ